ncbi:MAG TPA: RNA methyltransferase [Vicinamibacterales bacterium]|nr:RNA methyltransferase [Vicinamibacterales bacterium]
MPLEPIHDATDPRVADYRNVPDPELVERSGVFIAEGRLVVRRLLTGSRFRTRSVMVTSAALASIRDVLEARCDVPAYVVPQALMNEVTGFNIHRGCLAIGVRLPDTPWTSITERARLVVVLERVGNADNIGSIFRHAAAFAADAVLLGPASADPLYRKAIRTSMGAALSVPFASAHPWPDVLGSLRALGFTVLALTPHRSAAVLADAAQQLHMQRVAVLLGHEGDGLTPEALAHSTTRVRIPMAAGVDSVNVATAAAIALYELTRGTER